MQKLIIDTDCGIDDAVAIMMALAHSDVEVIGITTVSGNVDVAQVTENVLRLLAYFDRSDIPVYHGASHALLQGAVRAAGVHGENGLGGVELPATTAAPRPETAPVGLVELLRTNPDATVVTLGPMTNFAMSLNLYPDAASLIGRLVAMGGGIEVGNVTRFAEFNFYADPEAVQFVLDRGLPMEVVPWDACIEHELSRDDLTAVGLRDGRGAELFFRLQDFVLRPLAAHLRASVHPPSRSPRHGLRDRSGGGRAGSSHRAHHGAGQQHSPRCKRAHRRRASAGRHVYSSRRLLSDTPSN